MHLPGVHLLGVHLIGVYLTSMHLLDVHLLGVYLLDVRCQITPDVNPRVIWKQQRVIASHSVHPR